MSIAQKSVVNTITRLNAKKDELVALMDSLGFTSSGHNGNYVVRGRTIYQEKYAQVSGFEKIATFSRTTLPEVENIILKSITATMQYFTQASEEKLTKEFKVRLLPGEVYIYLDKTLKKDNQKYYTVVKTIDTIQGHEAAQIKAKELGTKTLGSFTQNAIPSNLDTHYTVIESGYIEDEPSDEDIAHRLAIYSHVKSNMGDLIFKFVDKPSDEKSLAFSKVAELHYHASRHELTKDQANYIYRELNSSLYGKSVLAIGGWLFDFSDYTTKYIIKTKDSMHERYASNKESIQESENNLVYAVEAPTIHF